MRPRKQLNRWPLLGVLLTLVAIGAYKLVPLRQHSLMSTMPWGAYPFSSYSPNEIAVGSWVDEAKKNHLHCDFEKTTAWQQCGINFFYGNKPTKGVDLSQYNELKIKAKFKGQSPKVRVFMRTFNSAYSQTNDANSAKFMSTNLSTDEFGDNQTVTIGLNEFVVAQWWLDQRELKRNQISPDFTNVITFGLDFSIYIDGVKNVDFQIGDIWLEGTLIQEEHWYLSILAAWIVAILGYVSWQYWSILRSSKTYTKVITDLVTDKAQLEYESLELKKMSNHDRLTGAFNRHGIEQSINAMVASQRGRVMGLILMDVDHFKRVNDQRGHDVGDHVLKTIVELINNNIREHDVLGRWGGEEFLLITPNTDVPAAYRIAEKIRRLIANYKFEVDPPFIVTVSFGVTAVNTEDDFDIAFKRADIALYKAKAQGRNCSIMASEPEKKPDVA